MTAPGAVRVRMVVPLAVITRRTPPAVDSSVIERDAAPRDPDAAANAARARIATASRREGPEGPSQMLLLLRNPCRTERCANDTGRERAAPDPYPRGVEERVRDGCRNRADRRLARTQRQLVRPADDHVRHERCVLEAQERLVHPVEARYEALDDVALLEDPHVAEH